MSTVTLPPPLAEGTLADLLDGLGNVPPRRIRMTPLPGTATEQDVIDVERRTGVPAELVDGVLVEKTVGYKESLLAAELIMRLKQFVGPRKLGLVLGEAGTVRILPGQVRIPDVCFIRRDQFPAKLPDVAIPRVAPDLAVEILSEGNTEGEMQRKLHDYFAAGVRLVWYIDPRARTARVYTAPDACTVLDESASLSGGEVLPGFELSLRELFAEMDG
jgi:Uma2 family endonuclease